MQPREFASLHLMLRLMTLISTLVSKTVSYCAPLRFHPDTRNTGARWGPRRCAQACGARKGYLLSLPSIYEPVRAQEPRPHWLDPFASLRAGYAGLLSFAPVGAGSSPI